MKDNEFMCGFYETPRNLDWSEDNCERYFRCDTVAWAGDELRDKESETIATLSGKLLA